MPSQEGTGKWQIAVPTVCVCSQTLYGQRQLLWCFVGGVQAQGDVSSSDLWKRLPLMEVFTYTAVSL